jgi:serine/threonine protein phosphatase PrpC
MGGHVDGDVAADIAIRMALTTPLDVSGESVVHAAHKAIHHENGRGTTFTLAKIRGHMLTFAHAGDSRLWLVRDQRVYQLTEDHTVGGVQFAAGKISAEEFDRNESYRGLLSYCGCSDITVQIGSERIYSGDRVILTTDGLHVSGFRQWLENGETAEEAINFAVAHGSTDNATILIIKP